MLGTVHGSKVCGAQWLSCQKKAAGYTIVWIIATTIRERSGGTAFSGFPPHCTNVWFLVSSYSFVPDIYIALLQETYSEALSVQVYGQRENLLRGTLSPGIRPKRNVLRSLQNDDTLFWDSKGNARGS